MSALTTGKHVFVEKPLCINQEELEQIIQTWEQAGSKGRKPVLTIGHNRRYSPHSLKVKEFVTGRQSPMVMTYRVNAGFVPYDHWVHSDEEGGGRIIGEMGDIEGDIFRLVPKLRDQTGEKIRDLILSKRVT